MHILEGIIDCQASALYARSRLLYQHSVETAYISCSIGKLLNMDEEEITLLNVAGVFHDVGKLAILPEILQKPSELTSREKELVRAHPEWGVDHVKRIPYLVSRFGDRLTNMILMHHEEPDGTGYPYRKMLDDINIHTRILIIADRFQAMTTDRAYKAAYSPDFVVNNLLDYLLIGFFPDNSTSISNCLLNGVFDCDKEKR